LHPENRHVRDKIRQQLQVLRDLGLIESLRRGRYRNL
jgi:type II restriction enzyme